MEKIKKELDNIFLTILNVPKSKKKNHLNFKNVKKWDSLNHIKLILAIESKFKIRIDPDASMSLMTYKELVTYLSKK